MGSDNLRDSCGRRAAGGAFPGQGLLLGRAVPALRLTLPWPSGSCTALAPSRVSCGGGGRRTWRRTWGWSGRAWTWRTAKSWARCHACTAAQGEPGMGGVSAGTATPGATALAARLWLRAAALGERILRAAAPEHEASADRCARILGVLRKKVPNHIALAAIKMVSNAIRTTWRMGERGAPCFCRKRRRRGFSSALHGLPCSSMCRQA